MKIFEKIDKKNKLLLSNTIMLYIMTFSTQLLNVATVPYLTRVLGAVVYGKIGLALSYMTYIYIILDFGFILSATQKVVEHREDRQYLCELFTAVTIAKIALGVLISFVFFGITALSSSMREDFTFYMVYLISYIIFALMPDFLYRGFEQMTIITYRSVAIKVLFTVLIFVFVRDKSQYWLIPVFNFIGNAISVVIMYIDLRKRFSVHMCKTNITTIFRHVKDSVQFFASRAASATYQAANIIVLSFLYGNAAVIGYYTAADKISSLVKSGSSPVADSLYPYMIKNKNFRLVKKIHLIVMPVIFVACVFVAIFADEICVILFGSEYRSTGLILRLLLPYIFLIFPSYVVAFPVMVPMGLKKYANLSNIVGLILQFFFILILVIIGELNVYTLCACTSVTQALVLIYRLIYVFKYRKKPLPSADSAKLERGVDNDG
jgi:PST family polysaccharide transporter